MNIETMRKALFLSGVKSVDRMHDRQVAAVYERYRSAGKLKK